jgi:hypothetical protein
MIESPTAHRAPLDALRALHDELWDPVRGMDRFAPGAAPDIDISSLGLHSVRETASGAFLDLVDGNVERAVIALRNVLALQYPLSEDPWSGTFPVTAEQPDPPEDAVAWVHYDPNWRQFLGCILALCAIEHSDVLPDDVLTGISTALERCVAGEPDDRIPRWYTNPNLMHAWLQGHVAAATDDIELRGAALARVASAMERMLRYGDVDEYNSPTYDGIDLFALGLWATHPPSDGLADAASTMLPPIGQRISTLYHPGFGASCGPYIRAYGLDPTRYVSLSGLLFSVLGEPADVVLPAPIDAHTVHVHDLYFLPLLQHVAPVLRPHVAVAPVDAERHHEQRFRTSIAESVLRPGLAVGWDHGRRHETSLDQYVPFTAHVTDGSSVGSGVGPMIAFGIMLAPETAWVDVERVGDLEFLVRAAGRSGSVGLRLVANQLPTWDGAGATVGPVTVHIDLTPDDSAAEQTPAGHELRVSWQRDQIDVRVTIADPG